MKRLISAICLLFFLLPLPAQETYQKEIFISSRGDTCSIACCNRKYEKE